MTEAELWQVIFLSREITFNAFENSLAGISGYLIVAHFVGARLSRFQALLVSGLFALYECICLYVAGNQMKVARHYGAVLVRDFDLDFIGTGQVVVGWGGPVVFGSIIAACFYFMYQARTRPTLSAGPNKTDSD